MEISFISSLDPEEEERIASMLIAALGAMLDENAFPYTIRVRTSGMKLFQRGYPGTSLVGDDARRPTLPGPKGVKMPSGAKQQ